MSHHESEAQRTLETHDHYMYQLTQHGPNTVDRNQYLAEDRRKKKVRCRHNEEDFRTTGPCTHVVGLLVRHDCASRVT